jgi:hypothetical protein
MMEGSMFIQDRGEILDRTETPDGFLKVRARFARSGIQQYYAGEIGLTDREATELVNVYRPPEEVFSPESMNTFSGVPVTDNHPRVMLDTKNVKDYMVGFSGDTVSQDGIYMVGTLTLTSEDAIKKFRDGKKELSNGYRADLDLTPGTTPDGIAYHAVQRRIRGNHIALVDMGRCGPACRIMDGNGSEMSDCSCGGKSNMPGETNLTTVTVDSVAYQMSDQVASVVNKLIGDRTTAQTALAAAQADVATRDATIAGLRTDLENAKKAIPEGAVLDALIVERGRVLDKAKAVLGNDADLTGLPTGEVKKRVVAKVLGDTAANYTADQYSAAFDTIAASIKDSVRQGIEQVGIRQTISVSATDADKARTEMLQANMQRWQQPAMSKAGA